MEAIDRKIIDFIQEHHVLTLATSRENIPYCCNCFYIYIEEENRMVFSSDMETKHVADFLANEQVAGSIVLETLVVGKIQGIQINGIVSAPTGELLRKVKKAYLKRFPMAILLKTTLWTIDLNFIKMTDNRLGFGKKLIWNRI